MNDATTPLVQRSAIALAVLTAACIAIAAFVLSFSALWDVATRVWPNRHLSWLGPAVVDSTILQATVSLLVVANSAKVGERRYFWSLLIGAAATSIAGNALHAVTSPDRPLAPAVAALIACIPPIFLCLSTHSVIVLTRRKRAAVPDTQVRAGEQEEPGERLPAAVETRSPVEAQPGGEEMFEARDVTSLARSIRERYGLTTGTAQIAAVLHHRARWPEASLREVAAYANVHHNTVKKIVGVAAEMQLHPMPA